MELVSVYGNLWCATGSRKTLYFGTFQLLKLNGLLSFILFPEFHFISGPDQFPRFVVWAIAPQFKLHPQKIQIYHIKWLRGYVSILCPHLCATNNTFSFDNFYSNLFTETVNFLNLFSLIYRVMADCVSDLRFIVIPRRSFIFASRTTSIDFIITHCMSVR